MPSLDYLRSDSDDEIDPRSDFGLGSSFAQFICQDREPVPPYDNIDHPSPADMRQEVVLRLLELRVQQSDPAVPTCLVLVDGELDLAKAAYARARAEHYRQQRRLRRMRPGTEPHAVEKDGDGDDEPVRHGGYLDVAQVVRRILHERKPGIEPRVMRRVVVAMLDAQLVSKRDRVERARITARLRRLRKQTGLALDLRLL